MNEYKAIQADPVEVLRRIMMEASEPEICPYCNTKWFAEFGSECCPTCGTAGSTV